MAVVDPCETCGVVDALGRHAPLCTYAIGIGLPRLAEDEEAIDPRDSEEPTVEFDETDDESGLALLFDEQPTRIIRAPGPAPTALWFAYETLGDATVFDATVFDSELEALRHAVERGKKVHRLELGRSLREQVNDEPAA